MSISAIYNKLYCGEVVTIACTRAVYETVRTGLIHKYKKTAKLMEAVGDDSLLDSYVQATFDKDQNIATFIIKPLAAKKRKTLDYKFI